MRLRVRFWRFDCGAWTYSFGFDGGRIDRFGSLWQLRGPLFAMRPRYTASMGSGTLGAAMVKHHTGLSGNKGLLILLGIGIGMSAFGMGALYWVSALNFYSAVAAIFVGFVVAGPAMLSIFLQKAKIRRDARREAEELHKSNKPTGF